MAILPRKEIMICQSCKTEFEIRYDHQKYCSRSCARKEEKRRARERMHGVFDKQGKCERCEREFERKIRGQKYCSLICKELNRKEKPELKQKHAESSRRWREAHPEHVVQDKERLKKYRKPVVVRRCSKCGIEMNWRKNGVCKACERAQKLIQCTCKECGMIFSGTKLMKYCSSDCQKNGYHKNIMKAVNKWIGSNKDKFRKAIKRYKQTRRARMKNADTGFTTKEWDDVLKYFGNKCAYCGSSDGPLHQEHFVPVSKGGGYTKNNIVPACQSCNSRKGNRDPERWLPAEKYRYIANYLGAK